MTSFTLLIIVISVFMAVLSFFVGTKKLFERTEQIDQRLIRVSAAGLGKQDKEVRPKHETLNKIANRLKLTKQIEKQLELAYINNYSAGEWLGIQAAIAAFAFLAGYVLLHQLFTGIAFAILSYYLVIFYLKHRRSRRRKLFQDQLPDVLTLLVSSLHAGYGTIYALKMITAEMPAPSSQEFERVIQEITLGYSIREALGHLVERMDSDDLDLVVTAIEIQSDVGGNLAEILGTIASTIQERIHLKAEVKVMTAQQRMSGYVVGGLPVLLGGILFFINPEYMKGLWVPGLPRIILASTAVMVVVGFAIIQKLLAIDV